MELPVQRLHLARPANDAAPVAPPTRTASTPLPAPGFGRLTAAAWALFGLLFVELVGLPAESRALWAARAAGAAVCFVFALTRTLRAHGADAARPRLSRGA